MHERRLVRVLEERDDAPPVGERRDQPLVHAPAAIRRLVVAFNDLDGLVIKDDEALAVFRSIISDALDAMRVQSFRRRFF